MLWRSAVLVALCILPQLSLSQLPICTRVQACSARVDTYPLIEDDSSGWSSGLVPLYDEAFSTAFFDYTQTPETKTFELCVCSNNQTCDDSIGDRNLRLDEIVTLTFCEDVRQQLPLQCRGSRGLPRTSVESTVDLSTVLSTEVSGQEDGPSQSINAVMTSFMVNVIGRKN
ncbi:hypothetical protein COOONC_25081 [Cooperia oncophora]